MRYFISSSFSVIMMFVAFFSSYSYFSFNVNRKLCPASLESSIFLFSFLFLTVIFNKNFTLSTENGTTSLQADSHKGDQCNRTVEIYEDIMSPKVTPESYGKPFHCIYRFRSFRGTTTREWVLRIRFKKFKFGILYNATECKGGFMQIIDGNAKTNISNRKETGIFCGEIEQMQTFISETSFVKIIFQTDFYTDQTYFHFDTRAEQEFDLYQRYGKHQELYPNRRGQMIPGTYCQRIFQDCKLQTCYVQSPAFPGVYPRGLHCTYQLSTKLPFIKLYIENEFNVDGQRCENIITCPMRPISVGLKNCPYDYIRIYDGKSANSTEIGTFCGMGKFPFSIIGSSQDLFVEFITSRAGPLLNTGFHFNVGNWPGLVETVGKRVNGTCSWIFSSKELIEAGVAEGIFLSMVHWYEPDRQCTYLIQGDQNQIVRVHFPSLRINKIESPILPFEGDCGESLTLYDSDHEDDSRIIKTFCSMFSKAMEKHDFISTKNSMFVKFHSKTGSYSGSSIYYWAHYDFFNNTRFGTPVPGTVCDEEFSAWKQEHGWFRSPVNTLIYKREVNDQSLRCQFRFISDRRIYARVLLTIESINFKTNTLGTSPCSNCQTDKGDKLSIWEPSITVNRTKIFCLCSNYRKEVKKSTQLISVGENLILEMQVDVASNYFKTNYSLFEASFKFVHGPLCGPSIIDAKSDGELHFPYLDALGFAEPPREVHCVWDIQVHENRDLSLFFENVKLISRDCRDGRIEIHLPNSKTPIPPACGNNIASLRSIRIIASEELIPKAAIQSYGHVQVHFIGTTTPTRASFKMVWSELYHLQGRHRNDTSRL